MEKKEKRHHDFVWILCLLFVSGVIYVVLHFGQSYAGGSVLITVDGQEWGVYSLTGEEKLLVETAQGYNLIRIGDGKVWVEEADCRDGYCKQQGAISHTGESLICLPHKLVVEIRGGSEESEIDVIVR